MRKLKVAVAIIITAVIFIFVSCTTEVDPTPPVAPNFVTYDGTTYRLKDALIEFFGENTDPGESGYKKSFSAFTSGVDIDGGTGIVTGIGSGFILDLNSEDFFLTSGIYEWGSTRASFIMYSAGVFVDYDFDEDEGTVVIASSGTATVSFTEVVDDQGRPEIRYTVEFTLDVEGKPVTGWYSGGVNYRTY